MKLFLKALAIAGAAAVVLGCSILDPGDREELRNRVAAMPPSDVGLLTRMAMNAKALSWLRGRPERDQMGKLQCRRQAGGQWDDWADEEPTFTLDQMIECLMIDGIAVTYTMCAQQWEFVERQAKRNKILHEDQTPGVTDVECRFVWDFRYDPEKVSPKLTDPNAITTDDIIDAMIGLPAPPPGWVFPELVPLLCPLGAGPGWGCPDSPTDPGSGSPPEPDR